MSPDQLIRLECLKLALAVSSAERGGQAVTDLAGTFANFVRGADNAAAAAPAPAHNGELQDKPRHRHERR